MEIQKIGTYLIENQFCDDEMINELAILQWALSLNEKGYTHFDLSQLRVG